MGHTLFDCNGSTPQFAHILWNCDLKAGFFRMSFLWRRRGAEVIAPWRIAKEQAATKLLLVPVLRGKVLEVLLEHSHLRAHLIETHLRRLVPHGFVLGLQ